MRVSIEITDAPAEGAQPVQLRVQEQGQRPQAVAEFDGGPDTAGSRPGPSSPAEPFPAGRRQSRRNLAPASRRRRGSSRREPARPPER